MKTDTYRQQAYGWAGPGREALVDAVCAFLHFNESLHMHENIEGASCAYCWLRAGKAIRVLLQIGALPTPGEAWIYVDDDGTLSPVDYATRQIAQAHAEAAWRFVTEDDGATRLSWHDSHPDVPDGEKADFDLTGDRPGEVGWRTGWQVRRVRIIAEMPQPGAVAAR